MVSFCDIRMEEANFHRSCYGNNCIVLKKEWGIRNGISPVRYVHENSPGIQESYIKFKHRYREIRESSQGEIDIAAQDYTIFSTLHYSGKLKYESLYENIEFNSELAPEIDKLENEFIEFVKSLQEIKKDFTFVKYLRALMLSVLELHSELECRDAHMRAYKEDFVHPHNQIKYPDKILYDEREWRSIKFPTKGELIPAIENKFLPSNYNLKFSSSDVIAILCSDQKGVSDIKRYLQKNQTLLEEGFSLDKIQVIDNFNEID